MRAVSCEFVCKVIILVNKEGKKKHDNCKISVQYKTYLNKKTQDFEDKRFIKQAKNWCLMAHKDTKEQSYS